ncbi:FAD:protein FMN transferase [Nibricoccus sp. IMCC34717]|uniref:FAD:protein FMN transferase n=1 Tax=Nibricoccus sp. IMCC34717 TaxID=3034021 RepID=UPI00384A6303
MASAHRFKHEAMATWFEIRVAGGDPDYSRQAAEEAFRLINHLEQLLSRFRENSEVAALSRLQAGETVALHPDTFACLSLALEMHALTGGAFDPTLGPRSGGARGQLALAPDTLSATLLDGSVGVDLGAIGKGFALDRAASVLAEWGVGPALLIAGGSSILATGTPEEPWLIGVTASWDLHLLTGSVGTSGLAVKGQHILDPRTGEPATTTPARTWALSGQAAASDALSTAFMLLSPEDIAGVCEDRPECSGITQQDLSIDEITRYGRGLGVAHSWVRR